MYLALCEKAHANSESERFFTVEEPLYRLLQASAGRDTAKVFAALECVMTIVLAAVSRVGPRSTKFAPE